MRKSGFAASALLSLTALANPAYATGPAGVVYPNIDPGRYKSCVLEPVSGRDRARADMRRDMAERSGRGNAPDTAALFRKVSCQSAGNDVWVRISPRDVAAFESTNNKARAIKTPSR